MDHPERPSRHRNHDKWKRIIQPAGDSDSSEWSSDSDGGIGENTLHYQQFDSSGGGSSSNGNQQPSVNSNLNGSSQTKSSRDTLLGFSSVEVDTLKFEPVLGANSSLSVAGAWAADLRALSRLQSIGSDAGAGTSSSSFTHLMHHDYAEREVNNDRGNSDFSYAHPSRDPLLSWKRKRKWLLCNRPDVSSSVIDCSTSANTPSTSTSGLATTDETTVQEPDTGIGLEASINETPEDDRWRILSSNRSVMNSPTTVARKRYLDSVLNPTEQPSVSEIGIPLPGCSTSVGQATSIQTQTGLIDCGMPPTSTQSGVRPLSPCHFFTSSDWYVQKKVMNRNKQLRFKDHSFLNDFGEGSSVPEDFSHSIPRPEEVPEIQVLSMAGPSSSSSRIVYPIGSRHSTLTEEASTSEEPQTIAPAVTGVVEAEEEGVEVIMVDDTQSETPVDNKSAPAIAGSTENQQEQQEQQPQTSITQQSSKEEENVGPTSAKCMRLDDELLNQYLVGLLECPVCMEYMGPPIHQCRRGHLICSVCKPKLPSCPTCRSRLTDSRNLAMEKVADKLHYPCKNAHVGCPTTFRLRDKVEHEANCMFRSYRCIVMPPCEWKGQHCDIIPHVRQMHANNLLQGSEHVLEMQLKDFTEQSSQNWLVSALGELFRVNLAAVRTGRVQVFGCVLLLGPARRAPLFRYTLSVGPAEGDIVQRQMTYSRRTHSYVDRCSVYYSAGDSFHLRTESAQLFSSGSRNDHVMFVKLHIEKVES